VCNYVGQHFATFPSSIFTIAVRPPVPAAVYLKLGLYGEALAAAMGCLGLLPEDPKARYRVAQVPPIRVRTHSLTHSRTHALAHQLHKDGLGRTNATFHPFGSCGVASGAKCSAGKCFTVLFCFAQPPCDGHYVPQICLWCTRRAHLTAYIFIRVLH